MNNRLIVPVLALGIAALGAAASPAQAETDTLSHDATVPGAAGAPATFFWLDSVSLTGSGSTWTSAVEYQSQDAGSFSKAYVVPGVSFTGAGNFFVKWHCAVPPPGHSSQTFMINSGTNSSGTWTGLTGISNLATSSNGTVFFS